MLSEVTKHQLPWITTAFLLHAEQEEFQTKLSQFTWYQGTDNSKYRYLVYQREKDKLKLILQHVLILMFSFSALAGRSASPP